MVIHMLLCGRGIEFFSPHRPLRFTLCAGTRGYVVVPAHQKEGGGFCEWGVFGEGFPGVRVSNLGVRFRERCARCQVFLGRA